MKKCDEIYDDNSCFSKALEEERMFVLLARDQVAPAVIRYWADIRVAQGLNVINDPQIVEARACADLMEQERDAVRVQIEANRNRYRKRPVVIEAVQWTGANVSAIGNFVMARPPTSSDVSVDFTADPPTLTIRTLEGDMRADPGDWIIRGVKGEYYPCKPDIFAATYEAAR